MYNPTPTLTKMITATTAAAGLAAPRITCFCPLPQSFLHPPPSRGGKGDRLFNHSVVVVKWQARGNRDERSAGGTGSVLPMSLRVDFPATPNPGTSPADSTPQFLPAREPGQQIQTLTRHEHLAVSPSCSTGSTERAACPAPRAYPHVPGPSTGSCLPEAKLVGVRAARVESRPRAGHGSRVRVPSRLVFWDGFGRGYEAGRATRR